MQILHEIITTFSDSVNLCFSIKPKLSIKIDFLIIFGNKFDYIIILFIIKWTVIIFSISNVLFILKQFILLIV